MNKYRDKSDFEINKAVADLRLINDVLKYLIYDKNTGEFKRRITSGGRVKGSKAGHRRNDGYIDISIRGRLHYAHRIAWIYTYKEIPELEIDHINRIRGDNRIENSRKATINENQYNKAKMKLNTSGFKGVHWSKTEMKWVARISSNGKRFHLGYFNSPEKAHEAYCNKAEKLHHKFANAG